MKINGRTGLLGAMVCSLMLGSAFATAADDATDAQKEAAKKRYEMAKESCKQMEGNAKDACEEKAKAEYHRDKAAMHKDRGTTTQPGTME